MTDRDQERRDDWRPITADELAEASIELAATRSDEDVPASLKERLVSSGRDMVSEGARPRVEVIRVPVSTWGGRLGWLAAAACLGLAAGAWLPLVMEREDVTDRTDLVAEAEPEVVDVPVELSAAERFAAMRAAEAAMVVGLRSLDASVEGARGEVVWDNASQAGFVRLDGLAVNDPAEAQYQLWIVDPERDDQPIDGGVFDVTAAGEVVIAIDAKLAVVSPTAFAITRERPGGVVVSDGPMLMVGVAPGS
ncbi:anti-sigma factor domain-containing protein [Mucisphaera sp.]|uniref:anti-sigma factor domain-containing protein n=1 Tax=Mucisphaera sp. TaxID=2913024 RepID=UPI003D0A9696